MTSGIDLIRLFRRQRILVIGDAMLDSYLEGTAARLCSEGPVPVVRKTTEHRAPGGAANTAANARTLGGQVRFLGIIGHDAAGELLRAALRERAIDDSWLCEDAAACTMHKMRILADGHYVVRFDDEHGETYSPATHAALLAKLDAAYAQSDAIIISDYGYGVASDALLDRIKTLRARTPKPLLVDSKDLLRFRDIHATVITPNLLEARQMLAHGQQASRLEASPRLVLADVAALAHQVLDLIDTETVAITLAEQGVFLADRRDLAMHLPAHPVAQANVAGAGDSFTAALALAVSAGGPLPVAAQIASDAAGIAVTKRFTAVVEQRELLQRVSLRDHSDAMPEPQNFGDTADRRSLSHLAEHLAQQRAAGHTIVFTNGVFDILHAGHVALLRQARALGDILVVGVNSDASVRRSKGPNRPINRQRDRVALVAALDGVDHVVLFDEDTPADLIRMLRPTFHVKGGDYAEEDLPEAPAVREVGGKIVIVPLAGKQSTSRVIDRILLLAGSDVALVKLRGALPSEPLAQPDEMELSYGD